MIEHFLLSFFVVFAKIDLNFHINLLGVFPLQPSIVLWYFILTSKDRTGVSYYEDRHHLAFSSLHLECTQFRIFPQDLPDPPS